MCSQFNFNNFIHVDQLNRDEHEKKLIQTYVIIRWSMLNARWHGKEQNMVKSIRHNRTHMPRTFTAIESLMHTQRIKV